MDHVVGFTTGKNCLGLVPDMASRKCPSYAVQILEPGSKPVDTVITLFSKKFSSEIQEWWYSKKPGSKEPGNIHPY